MRSLLHRSLITAAALLLAGAVPCLAAGPEPVPLWPEGAPGAMGDEDRDRPELRIYLPSKEQATGAGVVVCPGGGYGALATDHEGHQVAKWLNSIGVAGFVLKYRLAPHYKHPAPLNDAQRAMRHVRANADKFGLAKDRIGIMGFSAGGHLASTVATHFDAGNPESDDPIERASCRPDFAILCYPVISMTETFGHTGSRKNLLGENPDPQLADLLSNEKQVTAETPPTFLFHTGEDTGVPVENSLAFYAALRKAKVPAELHVYQHGPHGVGLAPGDPAVSTWKDRLADWLKGNGFLADVERAEVRGKVTVDGEPLRWGAIAFVPEGSKNLPVAWGLVSRGSYHIPAGRGAVIGMNRVEIRSLGAVEPAPTIEDVSVLADAERSGLTMNVQAGANTFDLDLKSP